MLGKKIDCLEWCFNRKYRIIPERYNFNLTGQIKDLQQRRTSEISYELVKSEDKQNQTSKLLVLTKKVF